MALILSVTYEGGKTEDIRIKPAGIVAAERKWGKNFPDIEGTIYAAWFTKGKPGGDDGFDTWMESLDEATDHKEPSPPLAQGPSPEG